MATGVTQVEVDLLTARIDDLTRFLVEATTERDELRELAGELSSELSEWRKTPFFQDEDEWVEWRNGLGRRVDASLAKAKALGIGGEG